MRERHTILVNEDSILKFFFSQYLVSEVNFVAGNADRGNLLRKTLRNNIVVSLLGVFRNQRIVVVVLFSCLLTIQSLSSSSRYALASVVWTDSFDNGDYDEWSVALGAFRVIDGTLRGTGYILNAISHPSTLVTGTWRIDLEFTDTPHYSSIYMFVEDIGQGIGNNGYWLYITNWRVTLHRETEFVTDAIANYSFPRLINGWQHFDVTRDTTGRIRTFINGTLCMDVIDTRHNTAKYFLVQLRDGDAIDNVEVSNTIDIEPQPTNLPPRSAPVLVLLGAFLVSTLFISLILGLTLRRRYPASRT